MNFELYIAQKIHFTKERGDNRRATPPVVRIAMAGIALGLAVMIVSVAIVIGFKKEVRNKVIGFGAHIQISNFDNNSSYESVPIIVGDSLRQALLSNCGISHVEAYATKPGIVKTETDFQGIVMKGVESGYDSSFFKKHLVEGKMIHVDSSAISNDVLISRFVSNQMRLKYGESFIAYFVKDDKVRARKFQIAGVYDTGFSEYDKLFVICDIRHIKRLNGWDDDMASGVGIFIDNYDDIDQMTEQLYFSLIDKADRMGNTYYVRSIKELNPMIFNWLDVLDSNVVIILILMIAVAGFTMISGLLIIILERTNMIGILKALGENNGSIRNIFLYVSLFLIVKGMLWGNAIGLGICLIQKCFHVIPLNPETYYLNHVPIDINIWNIILINAGTLAVSMLMMLAPSYLITKIEPAKSIRFE